MTRSLTRALLGSLCLLPGLVRAADHPTPPDPAALFAKFDTNGDASISLDEFKTGLAALHEARAKGHHPPHPGDDAGGPPPASPGGDAGHRPPPPPGGDAGHHPPPPQGGGPGAHHPPHEPPAVDGGTDAGPAGAKDANRPNPDQMAGKAFAAADSDGDGKLNAAEFAAALKAMPHPGGKHPPTPPTGN